MSLTHYVGVHSGRQLATPLLTVPDPQLRPDYYELITDPIALDTIEVSAATTMQAHELTWSPSRTGKGPPRRLRLARSVRPRPASSLHRR